MNNSIIVKKEDILADERFVMLSVILASEYYLGLMDQLKEFRCYNSYLRNGAKLVSTEMTKYLSKDADLILGIDDTMVYALQDNLPNLMRQCARLRPEYIGVVNEIINRLIENPQETLEYFQLNIVDNAA